VAGEPAQGRTDQQLEHHEAGDGVARQPVQRGPGGQPERLGHAGLHGHPEAAHVAEGGQDLLGVVAVAHRHPARGHHQVALGGGQGEPAAQGHRVVAELAAAERLGPGRPGLGDQQPGVRVADLAGPERVARVDQLVAGGHHRHPGPWMDRYELAADRGEHADGRRVQQLAPLEDDGATADVLAGLADEPAGPGVQPDQDGVALDAGLLDRHDRVGARRQRPAGHDAGRAARLDGGQPAGAGEDLAGDPKADRRVLAGAGQVGRPDREAVHGRVGERRQVLGGGDVGGEHAAEGVAEPRLPGRERAQPLEHAGPRLLERHQVGRVGPVGGKQ
jgi:hypothetical protein